MDYSLVLLNHGHALQEVGGSNPGHGTIVERGFHPVWKLARFSSLNITSIVNSKFA